MSDLLGWKKKVIQGFTCNIKSYSSNFSYGKKSNLRPKNYSCIICCYFVQSEKKSYLVIFGWNLEKKIQKVIVISKLQFFKAKLYTRL